MSSAAPTSNAPPEQLSDKELEQILRMQGTSMAGPYGREADAARLAREERYRPQLDAYVARRNAQRTSKT